MIETWAIIATGAMAAFAIGAFIAVEQDRHEQVDSNWVKAERLHRRARDIVYQDRREAGR